MAVSSVQRPGDKIQSRENVGIRKGMSVGPLMGLSHGNQNYFKTQKSSRQGKSSPGASVCSRGLFLISLGPDPG